MASAAGAAAGPPPVASAAAPEVPAGVEAEAQLLEAFCRVPILTRALLRPGAGGSGLQVTATFSQHNLGANSKRQLQQVAFIPDPSRPAKALCGQCSALPTELPSSLLTSVAPSGGRMVVAKNGADGVVLELWNSQHLERELVAPKTLHGAVVNDNWFSRGAAWSPDETRVAYLAEAPAPERTPLWCGSETKDAAAPKGWRGVARAEEDWGELNTGKRPPVVFVLDFTTGAVSKLPGQPADHSCGQPTWTPDGTGIVFQAWSHAALNFGGVPRRLGVVYCYNRPCHLYLAPAPAPAAPPKSGDSEATAAKEAPAVILTPDMLSASSPAFSPDGSLLLFLSHEAAAESGVHNATMALLSLPWPQAASGAEKARTVVPVVRRPQSPGSFPGLYTSALDTSAFADATTLLISSAWYSQGAILAVDVASGAVAPVTPVGAAAAQGSWTLLAVAGGVAAASWSRPCAPPQLMLARVPADGGGGDTPWDWAPVEDLTPHLGSLPAVSEALANLETHVLEVVPTVGDTSLPVHALVQVPRVRSGPCPVVVVPHGGPHSGYTASYYMPFGFLTALGYCVVAVNFRGSTGFGEDSLQSLPGHVGVHDVQDCVDSLDAAIRAGFADGACASVVGGSHGGFLTAHLIGQHPGRFKCAGLRNPVTDVALMTGVTDIPDWCFVESFGTEDGRRRFTSTPTAEDLAGMLAASPVAHVASVVAPVMMLLGSKDRRVPECQGRRYADALRAHGVPVRTLVFPEDTHALDKPQTEYEQWVNLAWWLKEHALGKAA